MHFIQLHDQDGLLVLVNLNQVEAILELPDGFCSIVFSSLRKKLFSRKTLCFYPMETYEEVFQEINYNAVLPGRGL